MYVPKVYAAPGGDFLHDFVRRHPFGLLVSRSGDSLAGSHIPFLLDAAAGPRGTLLGHLARANPQWKELEAGEAMVAFSGPDAYVSPSWYADQVTVPTWNYAAVHAYGRPRLVRDVDALRVMVERLTREHEERVGSPWRLEQAAPILEAELRGIVGFEIPIDRLEGKLKLGQNRSTADRAGVVQALRRRGGDAGLGVATLMAAGLEASGATERAPTGALAALRVSGTRRPVPAAVAALYRAAGLGRPVDDLARLDCMFADANVVWSAWEGDRLVGVLRGWTDGAFDGYVCDLAVDPVWQGRGLGRELLRRATAANPEVQWVLRASTVAARYYEHLGWEPIGNGWCRRRAR